MNGPSPMHGSVGQRFQQSVCMCLTGVHVSMGSHLPARMSRPSGSAMGAAAAGFAVDGPKMSRMSLSEPGAGAAGARAAELLLGCCGETAGPRPNPEMSIRGAELLPFAADSCPAGCARVLPLAPPPLTAEEEPAEGRAISAGGMRSSNYNISKRK